MNTKSDVLRKHYDKLTALERFRLVLAADERGDESEVRVLRESAPQSTYRMTAWPYRGMCDAILDIGMATTAQVLGDGYALAFCLFRESVHDHMIDVGAADDDDDDAIPDDAAPFPAEELAERVLVGWDALALFCQEAGITLDQACLFVPNRPLLESVVYLAQGVLDMYERDFVPWLMDYVAEHGDPIPDRAALLADRAANMQRRRAEKARELTDMLWALWEKESGAERPPE